jgi:hypothetical protein
MVARNGFPAMLSLGTGVASVDWATPAPAGALGLLGPGLELLPKALSSWAVTCARSRGIESVTPTTRTRAVAVASTGRSHMPGVRSA